MPLHDDLVALLGQAHVLPGADLARYRSEWSGHYRPDPAIVARPGNTEEVAAVMKIAARHGVPVVPVAGRTGLVGGAMTRGGLMVSVERLNRIREVRAGTRLAVVEVAMDRSGDIYLAGNFYSTVKPCHGQQNPDLCPPDLISWSPKNQYDAYVVKLDGTTLDAVWGLPHDAGGPDGALALTVKENKLVAVTGYCNGNADVLAMVFGADGGLLSSACFASTSPNTAGWATQWLPDGHAMIAGVFATSLALGDPPLTAGSTDASGFFAALHPLNLKPQARRSNSASSEPTSCRAWPCSRTAASPSAARALAAGWLRVRPAAATARRSS